MHRKGAKIQMMVHDGIFMLLTVAIIDGVDGHDDDDDVHDDDNNDGEMRWR